MCGGDAIDHGGGLATVTITSCWFLLRRRNGSLHITLTSPELVFDCPTVPSCECHCQRTITDGMAHP